MTGAHTPSVADVVGSLSTYATYGALTRKVKVLRKAVSDYDCETAKLKQKAEREGGPAARFVVDQMRAPAFKELRERLRASESDLAAWKPRKKVPAPDVAFSDLVRRKLAPSGYGTAANAARATSKEASHES